MYKIYCTIITPRIEALAKELNVSAPFANNLVSTWQSCKNMPGVEPDVDELREFMEANKVAMRMIQVAMPVYDVMTDPNFGPGAMVNGDASIILNKFGSGATIKDLDEYVNAFPELAKHKDLVKTFNDFYAIQLYAAKNRVNRGLLDSAFDAEDYDYAAKLLKQAKKEFPNEFPAPTPVVQPTVTQEETVTKVLGADILKQDKEAPKEVKEEAPAYVADPNDVPKIGIEILSVDKENPRARLVRDFTPFELSSRVENIARRFSDIVDEMVEELISEKQEKLAEAVGSERDNIEKQLKQITDPVIGRRIAIEAITFNKIYDRIKEEFQELAETSAEEFDEDYGEGNGIIIKDKYQKIVNNFEALFEDACTIIEGAENLRVVVDKVKYNNGKTTEDKTDAVIDKSTTEAEKEEAEFGDDEDGQRATGNDGWSFKVRFVDPYSSLSADVKRALYDIKRVNLNGELDLDDLGNVRYLSESHAHAVLIDKLSNMIDADDFSAFDEEGNLTFPALGEIAKREPWVNQVINKLQAEPNLASLFFADFRKDFIPYWKQKMNTERGVIETFPLNQPVALDSTMNRVILDYEQGTVYDEDSIYDSSRRISIENAKKGVEIADNALLAFQEIEDEEEFEELAENITKGLRMLGFNTSPAVINSLLETELGMVSVENVARAMGEIFEASQSLEDNAHLVSTLSEPYKKIAAIVGEVTELDNVQSFHEGDKTYYSYSAPNYVDTMFKLFKSDARRQEYIDSQFKAYDWFFNKRTQQWKNEWLNLLESDSDVQDKLAMKELNNIDGVEYTSWEPYQIKQAFVMEYFSVGENKGSKKQFAWYNFPIFSDSPVVKFVKFLRYTSDKEGTFKSKIMPLLNKVVRQELSRIRLVEERRKAGASKIQNFDKVGDRFHFFPELNSVKIGDKSFLDTIREMSQAKDAVGIENLINEQVEAIMDNNFNNFLNEFQALNPQSNGMEIVDVLINQGIAATKEGVREKLEEYFWNQSFASSQIIQLTTTDLAFYKNGTDFQKRYKEIYAAGTKLNTNSKYGRKKEKTIYLADNIVTSANYLDIKKNLLDAQREGRLTDMDVDNILSKFKDINVADAQAYRSITSFRSVLDMMGLWNDKMEEAVERFTHGEWDMADFNLVWQTIKPFVFTQIDKPDGLGGRMKVPHQNKNSEFLLLSSFAMIANRMSKSPKMRALNRFMEDNQIDVSQFESAVKAGGQGIIDISVSQKKVANAAQNNSVTVKGNKYELSAANFSDIKKHFDRLLDNGGISQEDYNDVMQYFEPTEQEVYDMLESATKDNNGNFKEEVVHEIPYGDYVVQQPTPEHLFDVEAVFGSQFRNLLVSDMPEDIEITVNGQPIKGRDNIQNLYQSLIVENLLEDYNKLSKRFATIEDLQKAMLDTVKGNPKYGRDMLDALRIVEHVNSNGERVKTFNIPLHNPSTTVKIQELVNSMFKNAITKQHIKGGNCILVSNFGFTDKLHILRGEDGSVRGAECYMPFYTKKYFQPFMKDVIDENGNVIGQEVDINAIRKQDPDLLKMVGYRIPTEDKYSMLPLIIKGFLPQQNGSAIMLPADVTQIAGSDFDVDKLFLMIPEFRVSNTYDIKAAWDAFYTDPANSDIVDEIDRNMNVALEDYIQKHPDDSDITLSEYEEWVTSQGVKKYDFSETAQKRFTEWFKNHKDDFFKETVIKKVRYNNDKEVSRNNRKQRNNMIIDIAFGILTHKDTAEKINNPGSFDKAKLAARVATISNDRDILNSYMEENGLNSVQEVVSSLLKADLDTLNSILDRYKRERNPLSVNTFIYNHRQNMTGGALIGMYANNTTMQAKFQRTKLALKASNSFVVNGRHIQSLHEAYVKIGNTNERISKNCANFSAASVDNVKDPVLADLLQNTRTANIAGFMLRAGMSIQEIGLFFTQPIVRECIETTGNVNMLKDFIKMYMGELKRMGGGVSIKEVLKKDFTSEELLSNILLFNRAKWGTSDTEFSDGVPGVSDSNSILHDGVDIRDILASNIQSAALFMHIANMSKTMSELTKISRADSPNGAIERSIARMKNQTHRVDRFIRASRKDEFPFTGVEGIMRNNFIDPSMSIDEMRDKLNGATMPMLQAFYSLGIDFGQKADSKYFAQLNPYINELVEELYRNSPHDRVDDRVLEKFYSELVTFGLSKTTTFGNDENNTFDQKRDYYLYDFPKNFVNTITSPSNKEIANLSAIRKLRVEDGKIIMNRSGRLTPAMREMLMRDFDSLLYMNETARKLAVDLFMYAYYQDGFNFGPNSYGNFFSTNFITSIPEVVNSLRDMSFNINSEPYWNRFLEQFYANHLGEGILPSFYSEDSFKSPRVTNSGQIILERKTANNRNLLGNKVFKLVTYDGNLYQVDPNLIGEKEVVYNPVKTYTDPERRTKYNANMTAAEMAEVEVNEARVEAAKTVNTATESEAQSQPEPDFDMNSDDMQTAMEEEEGGDYSFEDGLASLDETPCNLK